jgi:hypothetical protein
MAKLGLGQQIRRRVSMQRILATGWLKKKVNGSRSKMVKYSMTCLNKSHLPQVMALQEVICQNLQRPDLLQPFPDDFMAQHMGRRGIVLGVFVEDRIAAFRNLYYPKSNDRQWNLGIDIGLADAALTQVVNLQMVCVHPLFRGNALALKMNQIALNLLCEKGTHPHVCATVSPYNVWNIPVLLQSGFAVAKLKSKYGGKVRHIVYQNLDQPLAFDDQSQIPVSLDDLDTQKKVMNLGYYGVDLKRRQRIGADDPAGNFDLIFKLPSHDNMTAFDLAMPPLWRLPQEKTRTSSLGLAC